MGYSKTGQNAQGILTRLYSRAFIVAEPDESRRVVFVSIEIGMVSQRLRLEVLNRLQSKYGSLYRRDNVILSGTHTHSAPAGYFQYSTFVIASGGFSNRTFEYMVAGIMKVLSLSTCSHKITTIRRPQIQGSIWQRKKCLYNNVFQRAKNSL